MIRNKIFDHTITKVVKLGYADHFAQVMNIAVECPLVHSGKTVKRVFSIRNIEIFKKHLKNKILEDVYLCTY
jgi:hypothetical protein